MVHRSAIHHVPAQGSSTSGHRRGHRLGCTISCVASCFLVLGAVAVICVIAWATTSDHRGAALIAEDRYGATILAELFPSKNVADSRTPVGEGGHHDVDRLPGDPYPFSRPRHPWRAYFIALNLFNNAPIIPKLAANLAKFIKKELAEKGLVDVASRVFISVFSNGSDDTTAEDIEAILVPAIEASGVSRGQRMHIVPRGTACGGHHKRPKDMDRIVWMACIRNEAMRPLYEEGMALFAPDRVTRSAYDAAESADNRSKAHYHELELPGDSTLTADDTIVLFLNDILFAPTDLTKLLETNYARSRRLRQHSARRAAARSVPQLVTRDKRRTAQQLSLHTGAADDPVSGSWTEASFSALWDGFNMACGMDYYTTFYDQWVTRDYDGRPFDPWPPYAKDGGTQQIFYEAEALRGRHHYEQQQGGVQQGHHIAAPVRCCWNGVAAIRSSMFIRHGVRFRVPVTTMFNMSRDSDMCYSSECMLICQDILRAAVCNALNSRQGTDEGGAMHVSPFDALPPVTFKCPHNNSSDENAMAQKQKVSSPNSLLGDDDSLTNGEMRSRARRKSRGTAHRHDDDASWVDVGGIFINPQVKVAYDEDSFYLHQSSWPVSRPWFFRLVSFCRVGTWMLPDAFDPPGGGANPAWMECVLPQDTLPWTTLLSMALSSAHASAVCGVILSILVAALLYRFLLSSRTRRRHCLMAASWIDRASKAVPCHALRLLTRRCAVRCARHHAATVERSQNSDSDAYEVTGDTDAHHVGASDTAAVTILSTSNVSPISPNGPSAAVVGRMVARRSVGVI